MGSSVDGREFPEQGRRRIYIETVEPEIDGGRFPIKRLIGDTVEVYADLFADGHDRLAGAILYRPERERAWREAPLVELGNDRWRGQFVVDAIGRWVYTLEGWPARFDAWRHDLELRVRAGQEVAVELEIGARLIDAARARAHADDAASLARLLRRLRDTTTREKDRIRLVLAPELLACMQRYPDRTRATRYRRELPVVVDRERGEFSAWYEMFPRSCGAPGVHGTFADAERRLPYVASMGFDVLYLPPIHPIGMTHRKGKNNSLLCRPGDPGSPWAIGSAAGGHTAVHPQLGTIEEFVRFRKAAESHGLELALDIAFQASPDHPWVKEHPEWFTIRPDGTIQYAENPPKKYQDIYPIDFDSEAWQSLWTELCGVFRFWLGHGVRIFRVDNPHTKSLRFWEWCIDTLKREHPEALFLSEAFTKPSVMYGLSKLGFSQSYTYFTWRVSKHDLIHYMTELTRSRHAEYFRPNLWPNTPDILPEHLQSGQRSVFLSRLILAATLSGNYGIYGPAYELRDHVPRHNSGEYIDNEKYQLRDWPIERADNLRHVIRRINRIRRDNPALHRNRTLRFHHTENDALLCYSKRTADHGNVMLMVVNLDPSYQQGGFVDLDVGELGVGWDEEYTVHDLIADSRYRWRGGRNFVQIDPYVMPAHVFRLIREAPR